ncbi:hypothetical protein [Formosa sp. S-31]|uniref:hypothetical protein n=1 Tax=Formosa sp. S-31 TaxID=2790949 RepID=UPI003EB6F910
MLWQCVSAQVLEDQVSFEIVTAEYSHWVAGVKGGGSGYNISLKLKAIPAENIVLNAVYFDNYEAKLTQSDKDNTRFFGKVLLSTNQQPALMNDDKLNTGAKTETEAVLPKFDLKSNECVIEYTEGNKTKYFKSDKLEKKAIKHPQTIRSFQ